MSQQKHHIPINPMDQTKSNYKKLEAPHIKGTRATKSKKIRFRKSNMQIRKNWPNQPETGQPASLNFKKNVTIDIPPNVFLDLLGNVTIGSLSEIFSPYLKIKN